MIFFYRLKSYLHYLLSAKTKYYLHSPFVYELAEEVIYDQRQYYAFNDLAHIRAALLNSNTELQTTDWGAGSNGQQVSYKKRLVRQLAHQVAVSPQIGKLLFRLVNRYQPQQILELGTSIGIGTLYMAMACKKARITTIEGCPETANFASQLFQKLQIQNVAPKVGNFDDILSNLLETIPQVDIVFFDGNHQYEPTLRYFELCLTKIHANTIFIFDDIHWSPDMERAWEIIKQHPKVTITIDLYRVGLVFFRQGQAKENFTLYFF